MAGVLTQASKLKAEDRLAQAVSEFEAGPPFVSIDVILSKRPEIPQCPRRLPSDIPGDESWVLWYSIDQDSGMPPTVCVHQRYPHWKLPQPRRLQRLVFDTLNATRRSAPRYGEMVALHLKSTASQLQMCEYLITVSGQALPSCPHHMPEDFARGIQTFPGPTRHPIRHILLTYLSYDIFWDPGFDVEGLQQTNKGSTSPDTGIPPTGKHYSINYLAILAPSKAA
ncbi:hypothetical protein BJ170DRAFT_130667 [Xylariales sp. AK1849]|nr:hypothetical protein BJ170DRAFT_130667 [Xylariales sp. AK1849]